MGENKEIIGYKCNTMYYGNKPQVQHHVLRKSKQIGREHIHETLKSFEEYH